MTWMPLMGQEPLRKLHRSGTERAAPLGETLTRCRTAAQAIGVSRIADITGLDVIGIPVVMVIRPTSRSLSVSQGKGLCRDSAMVSGMMEAIESHHAENLTGPLILGSHSDLAKSLNLVEAGELPRLTTSLYHPGLPLLWTSGLDLFSQDPIWAPLETVSLDFTVPRPAGFGCFVATSNGLASGNHMTEALVSAVAELVERDADHLWSLAPPDHKRRTQIDLASVDDSDCHGMLARLARAGIRTAAWDITSDLGIAAVRCSILQPEPVSPIPVLPCDGVACHPKRAIALVRALLEAVQSRLTIIAGSRDDLTPDDYDPAQYRQRAFVEEAIQCPGVRDFADLPNWEADSLDADLLHLLDHLQRSGIHQVAAVNLTRPDIGIPVVRVVAPGLAGLREDGLEFIPCQRIRQAMAGIS